MQNTSKTGLEPSVYGANPSSSWRRSRVSSSQAPPVATSWPSGPSRRPPNPSWGIGLPVSIREMNTAGTRKATIRIAYCATWVHVMPFMPPSTA